MYCLCNGAQEKTRTSTTSRSQAPEACASTNSATWAVQAQFRDGETLCQPANVLSLIVLALVFSFEQFYIMLNSAEYSPRTAIKTQRICGEIGA